MSFKGHQFYRIGKEWVFDLTDFKGYKVEMNGDQVVRYYTAFIVKDDEGRYSFMSTIYTPIDVMKRVENIVETYKKEALMVI